MPDDPIEVGRAADAVHVGQHPNSPALVRAMRPRARRLPEPPPPEVPPDEGEPDDDDP